VIDDDIDVMLGIRFDMSCDKFRLVFDVQII